MLIDCIGKREKKLYAIIDSLTFAKSVAMVFCQPRESSHVEGRQFIRSQQALPM
jgi:hypothetical protein